MILFVFVEKKLKQYKIKKYMDNLLDCLPTEILHYMVKNCMDCPTWIRCMMASSIFHVLNEREKEIKKDQYLSKLGNREIKISGVHGNTFFTIIRMDEFKYLIKPNTDMQIYANEHHKHEILEYLQKPDINYEYQWMKWNIFRSIHDDKEEKSQVLIVFPNDLTWNELQYFWHFGWPISKELFLISDYFKVMKMFTRDQFICIVDNSRLFWGKIKL